MPTRGTAWLTLAATASFAVAVLHVAIAFTGTAAYAYFGAPTGLVDAAERGSAVPALITLLIALMAAIFGLFALSGAGRAPALPALRIVLVGISGIYLLRGLVVVPELVLFLHTSTLPPRMLAFSAAALVIGIVHTVGTALRWPSLPRA